MKVQIEIDCTPEEFKELLIPSDRQAEFAARASQALMEAMQKAAMAQMAQFGQQFAAGQFGKGGPFGGDKG